MVKAAKNYQMQPCQSCKGNCQGINWICSSCNGTGKESIYPAPAPLFYSRCEPSLDRG